MSEDHESQEVNEPDDGWEEFRHEDSDPISIEALKALDLTAMPDDIVVRVMDNYFPDRTEGGGGGASALKRLTIAWSSSAASLDTACHSAQSSRSHAPSPALSSESIFFITSLILISAVSFNWPAPLRQSPITPANSSSEGAINATSLWILATSFFISPIRLKR